MKVKNNAYIFPSDKNWCVKDSSNASTDYKKMTQGHVLPCTITGSTKPASYKAAIQTCDCCAEYVAKLCCSQKNVNIIKNLIYFRDSAIKWVPFNTDAHCTEWISFQVNSSVDFNDFAQN